MEPRICTIADCDGSAHARGLCLAHYARLQRTGDPLSGGPIARQPRKRTLAERFWSKVSIGADDACWEWGAWRTPLGYGRIQVGGRAGASRPAHRVAYMLHSGLDDLPSDVVIRHSCNNPPCCNPAHLAPGSHADNTADKVRANRQARGTMHPMAKLVDADVIAIRCAAKAGRSKAALAREFGVSESLIRLVVRHQAWKHVTS